MINENLKLTGNVKLVVTNKNGIVKDQKEIPNLVVKAGRDFIASRMIGTSLNAMSHMAVGSTDTAVSASDTALVAEAARVTLDSSSVGDSPDQNVVTYVATFPVNTPSTTLSAVEAGIFNASTAGTMLCRTTFPVVNKTADDILTITWTITINAA